MKKPILVGLTGGIGSGKSTVAKIFSCLDVPIFNSDDEAKKLMHENEELIQGIKNIFGEKAYQNGALNRSYLAEIVFKQKDKLTLLNGIVHPAVEKATTSWLEANKNQPYVIKEVAILFETGLYRKVDASLTVHADEEIRIQRVMERDQTNRAAIVARMNRQLSEEFRLSLSQYIIDNNGEKPLIPQVLEKHHLFLAMAQASK